MKVLQDILLEMSELTWSQEMAKSIGELNRAIKQLNMLRYHNDVKDDRHINQALLDIVNQADGARFDAVKLLDASKYKDR